MYNTYIPEIPNDSVLDLGLIIHTRMILTYNPLMRRVVAGDVWT